jgi:hypothetical protein
MTLAAWIALGALALLALRDVAAGLMSGFRTSTRLRGRVRVHLVDGPGAPLPSIEGVLLSRRDGVVMLGAPRVLEADDRSHELDSATVAVPIDRVAFIEVVR